MYNSNGSFFPLTHEIKLNERGIRKFFERIDKTSSPNGCWLWTGGKGNYGCFHLGNRNFGAHCISWMFHNGAIPKGKCVCHDCPGGDNKYCVNPAHLWLGTGPENTTDDIEKGMQAKGEIHGLSKLKNNQIIDIRLRFANGETCQAIALDYHMTLSNIACICRRETWRHI